MSSGSARLLSSNSFLLHEGHANAAQTLEFSATARTPESAAIPCRCWGRPRPRRRRRPTVSTDQHIQNQMAVAIDQHHRPPNPRHATCRAPWSHRWRGSNEPGARLSLSIRPHSATRLIQPVPLWARARMRSEQDPSETRRTFPARRACGAISPNASNARNQDCQLDRSAVGFWASAAPSLVASQRAGAAGEPRQGGTLGRASRQFLRQGILQDKSSRGANQALAAERMVGGGRPGVVTTTAKHRPRADVFSILSSALAAIVVHVVGGIDNGDAPTQRRWSCRRNRQPANLSDNTKSSSLPVLGLTARLRTSNRMGLRHHCRAATSFAAPTNLPPASVAPWANRWPAIR